MVHASSFQLRWFSGQVTPGASQCQIGFTGKECLYFRELEPTPDTPTPENRHLQTTSSHTNPSVPMSKLLRDVDRGKVLNYGIRHAFLQTTARACDRCTTYIQGYLTYKKMDLPRTLPWAYAWGHRGVLGEWAFPYGRGISVDDNAHPPQDSQQDP